MTMEKATDSAKPFDRFKAMTSKLVRVPKPYGFDAAEVARFAELIGVDWRDSARSWWYPGLTFRLIFSPAKNPAN